VPRKELFQQPESSGNGKEKNLSNQYIIYGSETFAPPILPYIVLYNQEGQDLLV